MVNIFNQLSKGKAAEPQASASEKLKDSVAQVSEQRSVLAELNALEAAAASESADVEERKAASDAFGTPVPTSTSSLAAFNTDALDPVEKVLTRDELSIKQLDAEAMLTGPAGVRELLDEVDRLVTSDEKMPSGLHLPFLRDYVRQLMITLKEHSEYESIFLDKDIHNVMKVVRALRREAMEVLETRKVKRATREAKASSPGSARASKIKKATSSIELSDIMAAFGGAFDSK